MEGVFLREMTMIKIQCSKCQRKLGVKDEAAGKRIKCPECGAVNAVPDGKEGNPLDELIAETVENGGKAKTKTSSSPQVHAEPFSFDEPAEATQACPFCGETILSIAKKCRHCGEFLTDASATVGHTARISQDESGALRFRGSYSDAFSLMEKTLIQCGGKIKERDINAGRLEGAWRYGINMFGLRVQATFADMGDGSIRISITGGFKDALDTFGSGKKKAMEIAQAFIAHVTGEAACASLPKTPSSGSFLPPRGRVDDYPHRGKSKTTAGVFGIILGGLGIHKFYLGGWGWGILYLLLMWTYIPAVVGFVEGIIYLAMSQENFDRKYNLKAPSSFMW
jgi:TM2 domain-containing membrane protein YozV/predicted RNA-binding Zn-ribbon protein involved in translation (DUF1610 family)